MAPDGKKLTRGKELEEVVVAYFKVTISTLAGASNLVAI
jgi:hypothetical protein